jgi:predicted homoserine dehydrogenase-like protein
MTEIKSDDLSMNLFHLLNTRRAAGKPVRVALIGAGKFGSMFLSQVPHTPGLEVPVTVDLDPQRAPRYLNEEICRFFQGKRRQRGMPLEEPSR